jgi:2-methylisocitrate lyase-like PEP mutase family enzyme
MSKLLDMFSQVRRAQSSSGMGFVGKSKSATKPRAAALVVEFTDIDAASAEAGIKAGADGLLFTWDGKATAEFETLKEAIDSAKASGENVVCGLHITGGWDTLERESLERLKDAGVQYIVLPLHAPARLLALKIKDLDFVVSVPMREGELYPMFIRNLTAFDTITAIRLDFWLAEEVGAMSIEDALHYRAVREAVRFPALLNVRGTMNEADALTLIALGVQAIILPVSDMGANTQKQVKELRKLLEKVHQEEKDTSTPTVPSPAKTSLQG